MQYTILGSLAFSLLPLAHAANIPIQPQSHTEDYKFNPLNHMPGISPYFDAVGSGLRHKAPRGCEVTAASYLVRHAAIYAQDDDYEKYMEPFFKKMDTTYALTLSGKKRVGWEGPLSIFEKWQSPIDNPKKQLEKVTPQGLKDTKKVSRHLLQRYPELIKTTKKIYADKKSRTQDTAKAFASQFSQEVDIVEISLEREFQAVTPHKFCDAFSKEPGSEEFDEYMNFYTKSIIDRLQRFSPVELTAKDIMGLQQTCGYETGIAGKRSDICAIFTDAEWLAYEYAWDMKYSYMVGHGNPLSPYLGFPWLNATSHIMSTLHEPLHGSDGDDTTASSPNDDGQRFFIAFTHREVPPFIATALGLFNSSSHQAEQFPTDRINWSRSWKMADLIPFLGHVGVEKLTCSGLSGDGTQREEFIRVIANTSPRPIPNCQDGPGASCSIDDFTQLVKFGMEKYGDFNGICGNKEKKGKKGKKTDVEEEKASENLEMDGQLEL